MLTTWTYSSRHSKVVEISTCQLAAMKTSKKSENSKSVLRVGCKLSPFTCQFTMALTSFLHMTASQACSYLRSFPYLGVFETSFNMNRLLPLPRLLQGCQSKLCGGLAADSPGALPGAESAGGDQVMASISCKSGKMAPSERTLLSLLSNDPAASQGQPISKKYPQVGHFIQFSHWKL